VNNVVNEIDYLKLLLDNELSLRAAANAEFNRGEHNGVMRQAHDAAIEQIVEAAQALISKAQST